MGKNRGVEEKDQTSPPNNVCVVLIKNTLPNLRQNMRKPLSPSLISHRSLYLYIYPPILVHTMIANKRTRRIIHPHVLKIADARMHHRGPAPLAVPVQMPLAPPRRVHVRATDPVVPRPVQVHALHFGKLDVAALALAVVVLAVPHPLRWQLGVLARRVLGGCRVGGGDCGGGSGGAVRDGEVEEVEVRGGEVFGHAEFGGGADLWGGERECHGAEGEDEGVGELHGWLVVVWLE